MINEPTYFHLPPTRTARGASLINASLMEKIAYLEKLHSAGLQFPNKEEKFFFFTLSVFSCITHCS